MDLLVKVLGHAVGLQLPQYQTSGSAGMDLVAAVDEDLKISQGEVQLIPTGIAIAMPSGFEAEIRSRSGLAFKNQVVVLNSPGTIDSDYRGEIKIILMNFGKEPFVVKRGMRVAQMVISRYETANIKLVEELPDSVRNDGGFGSTGI